METKKKHAVLLLVWISFLVLTVLVAPVSGGLEVSLQGDQILSRRGATSPVITVTDTDIPEDGTITIDITELSWSYVANKTMTDANVEVRDDAADATWTRQVESDGSTFILTLTSAGGATHPGESVTVTFTGAAGGNSAWNTGDAEVYLPATRSDTLETSDPIIILFFITPGLGGLAIEPGTPITTTDGATSMVITVTDEPVLQHDRIFIPVWDLNEYAGGGILTSANVVISDSAAGATWTGYVDADSILTLTSDDGDTAAGETVTVTFTGGGPDPWKAGAAGNKVLTASRLDNYASADFDFFINIPPPPGYSVIADFTGSPTVEIAPFTVTFTDKSTGHPTMWDWDWGDGTDHGTTKNPSHIYTDPGIYTVSLTASNDYSSATKTRYQYITALNGGVIQTYTAIEGLAITNCGGPQTVTVDTSVVPADLIPSKFVMEIQPPADRGLKNITIYAQNGIGFTRNGNLITGSPTRVHLESADLAPPAGFSDTVGAMSSFNFSTDLPSYPCNAILSTKISESILPPFNTKLQKTASGQTPVAVPIGTAYSATITKTNFPSSAPVKVRMSVNSSWNTIDGPLSGGPGTIFIWRIADDGNSGQILPTDLPSTDPVNKLDFYEADSPLGMSTFGISSFTGNNNPFQLITFAISSYIEPQNPHQPEVYTDNLPVTASVTTAIRPTAAPAPEPTTALQRVPESTTAKLYTNAGGVVTQATTLPSADGFVTVMVGTGVVAKDRQGNPLASITVTPVPAGDLPGNLPGGAFAFAGRAYELQPDDAVFSPDISLVFTAPPDTRFGQDFSIQFYDRANGVWKDVPSKYDPAAGTITGQVSHFCTFALFATTIASVPSGAGTNVPAQPAEIQAVAVPPTAMSIAAGMVRWIIRLLADNMVLVAVVILVAGGFLLYKRKKRYL